jgi:ATP/ADP translocase
MQLKKNKENFSLSTFVVFIMLALFFISMEYGITRPASVSLFIQIFSSKSIPWTWLAIVPFNYFIVYLYEKFLPKFGCFKIITVIAVLIGSINLICCFCLPYFNQFIFFQYIWKDVYILLMFKQVWSLVHTTVSTDKAKTVYGLLFAAGGFGAFLGGMIDKFCASAITSEKLFIFSAPLYLLVISSYYKAKQHSLLEDYKEPDNQEFKRSFLLIKESSFLLFVLLLVVFMEVSVAFFDFQFSVMLEKTIPNVDLRTEYAGMIVSIFNGTAALFQLVGSNLILKFLGLKRAHIFVPLVFCCNALLFLILPTFGVISYAYTAAKALDYSIFGVIREMLYIPMNLREKFRVKAFIDVFAYRTSKAIASFAIISMQIFWGFNILPLVSFLSLATFILWVFVVVTMFKYYEEKVKASSYTQTN